MKKISFLVSCFILFSVAGCKKEETLSDCEKVLQELDNQAGGFYNNIVAFRSETNDIIISESNYAFVANNSFFSLSGTKFNLCELKWYKISQNGDDRELWLFF